MDRDQKSYEDKIKKYGKIHADALTREINDLGDQFSAMIDKQRDTILEFYKATSEVGRQSFQVDLQSRQESMQQQLDDMKRDYTRYSKFMSKADRKNFQRLYTARNAEFDDMEKRISELAGEFEDAMDGLGDSFRDRMNSFADELRDVGMSLNLSSLAQNVEDNIDSYIENLRELKARSAGFDSEAFNKQVTSYAGETGILSRNAASEVASTFMTSMGIDNMKTASKYLKEIQSLSVMGIDQSAVENIVWQDKNVGSDGRFLRGVNNMAAMLDNNNDLAVTSDNILNTINETVGSIFGIAQGDSKKQTKLTKSVAMIEALQQDSANVGVTDIAEEVKSWFSYGTNYDFLNDDQFVQMAAATGYDVTKGLDLLSNTDALAKFIEDYQSVVRSWSDAELYSRVSSDQTAFANSASANAFKYMDPTDLANAIKNITNTLDSSDNLGDDQSVMTDNAAETVSNLQEIKNQFSGNGTVAKIADILENMDMSVADIGGIITIGSAAIKGVVGIGKLFGKVPSLSGLGSSLFSGLGKAGSSAGAGSLFSGLGSGGSAGAGLLGGSSLFGGTTATAFGGTLGSAIAAAGPLAGGLMTAVDAYKGLGKSKEWLGEADGGTLHGQVSSLIGGALGGSSGGVKGALGGAAKGALIGAFAGPVGMAIGGAIGGTLGAIGGEKIAKFADGTFKVIGDVANEAFNVMDAQVNAVNGVLQELGPVGQIMGNTLTDSWNAVKDTKQEILDTWADPNKGLVQKIGGTVASLFSGAGKVATSVVKGVKEIASTAWDGITGIASNAWSSITSTAKSAWEGLGNFANNIFDKAKEGVSTIAGAGKTILEGAGSLASGIGNGISSILFGSSKVDLTDVQKNLTGNPILDRLDIMTAYLKTIAEKRSSSSDNSLASTAVSGAKKAGSWLANKASGIASYFGFKDGLSYVPNDGVAMIHKGEAVLTASQADAVRAQADGGIDVINSNTSSTVNSLATTVNSLASSISSGLASVDEYYKNDKKSNKEFVKALNKSGLFGIKLGSLSSKGNLFTTMATALTGGQMSGSGGFLGTLIRGVKGVLGSTTGSSSTGLGSSASISTSGLSGDKQEFIDKIKPGAIEAYRKYHVLPSLTLAQGALESGWGRKAIGNNLFGIKAGSSWTGKTQTVRTAEYDSSGRKYYINAAFRDYPSISDSVIDHAQLLTGSRYSGVIAARDYREAANAVANAGYATSPTYASQLISLIESNGLNAWDNQYAKGTPWIPNDQVALIHEGEMIVPKDANPLNDASSTVKVGGSSDGDTVETLKWAVYRLEAKFDKLISTCEKSGTQRRVQKEKSNTDMVYSF